MALRAAAQGPQVETSDVALNAPVFRDLGPQPDAEFQYSLHRGDG
jgi:hypothetical protein